jgi:hypothetical protein
MIDLDLSPEESPPPRKPLKHLLRQLQLKFDVGKIFDRFIGLCVLVISGATFCLTISADRPDFSWIDGSLFVSSQATVSLTWNNTGKRPAYMATVTLFSINEDGKRHETFGEKKEIQVREFLRETRTITPTDFGTAANIVVDMNKFLGFILACVEYHDHEQNVYEQNYLFKPSFVPNDVNPNKSSPLNELPTSKHHPLCSAANPY